MKLHPVTLPVFVYGTLKAGGLYHHLIAHQIEGSDEATTRGSLYYKIFNCNQTGRREVTAAYSPDGPFPIAGTLLFPRASEYYSPGQSHEFKQDEVRRAAHGIRQKSPQSTDAL